MSARYEVWSVESTGTTGGMLKPGRVLRALASGLGLRAEEIGQITPTGRAGVSVEVRLPRAGEVATPLLLPVIEGDRTTGLLIQREGDEPPVGDRELLLTWSGGATPGPGAVAVALSLETKGAVGPEELGVGLGGPGWARVRVPEAMATHLSVPGDLDVEGQKVDLAWSDGGKKKALSSAERRLAEALGVTRRRLDAGRLPAGRARLRLAEASRRLLREQPGDGPLQQAVSRLAARGFAPPEPTELPTGGPIEMWTELSGRAAEDVTALAATLVTLPEPKSDPQRASAAMEVLLASPGDLPRATRLLESLLDCVDPATGALWDLRIRAAALNTSDSEGDPAPWESLLESPRARCEQSPSVLAAALHQVACGWWGTHEQPQGPVRVLGGRRLALVELTRWRHPDRGDLLEPATAWIREASDLGPGDIDDPIGAALDAMESLDRAGDFDGAAQALAGALDARSARDDLQRLLEARAELLNVGTDAATHPLPRPALPSPVVPHPQPPDGSWEARITSVTGGSAEAAGEENLAWLESVGLTAQAAEGWLNAGGAESLLQAWRLRAHLDAPALRRLTAALAGSTPAGDAEITDSALGRACGLALHDLLEAGPQRRMLGVRLSAGLREPDATADEDPHSAAHRLEAALDHMAEGRHVGAATAAASLLQRVDEPDLLERLMDLAVDLLSLSPAPEDLARAVERTLAPGEGLRLPFLRRLAVTPEATSSLLEALTGVASDSASPEHEALLSLRGLVGHYTTNEEPVPSATVRAITGARRAALLGVAAAMVGGHEDPVSAAREALLRTPPARSSGESVAQELLSLAQPS